VWETASFFEMTWRNTQRVSIVGIFTLTVTAEKKAGVALAVNIQRISTHPQCQAVSPVTRNSSSNCSGVSPGCNLWSVNTLFWKAPVVQTVQWLDYVQDCRETKDLYNFKHNMFYTYVLLWQHVSPYYLLYTIHGTYIKMFWLNSVFFRPFIWNS